MASELIDIFEGEINTIKQDENTLSIVLVGSSKDLDFNEVKRVNDIDLFIFTKDQSKNQIRINKEVSGVEFDLNYISKRGCAHFIETKEYFFLKINDGKIIFDTCDYAKDILQKCKYAYDEGPKKVSEKIKVQNMIDIKAQIEKLKYKDDFQYFEYDFLVNIALRDLIRAYYINNNKWLPKDKKLIKDIKKDDVKIYNMIKNIDKNEYDTLLDIFNYINYF